MRICESHALAGELVDMSGLDLGIGTYEHLGSDSFEFRHHLLMSARERGLDQLFQQKSRKFEQRNSGFRLEKDFYQQFQIEAERNVFFLTREERTFDQSLSRKIESLDLFYVTAMLKSVCQQVNRQNILG